MTKPGTNDDAQDDAQSDAKPHIKPFVVTDPAAADFLASPNTRHLLGPFFQGEATMSDAAAALGGMKLNTLHRRVRQMVKLGLLEETRLETRGTHRVKLYRATHREFVVPLEATSKVDLESFFTEGFSNAAAILGRGVAEEMALHAPTWGFRVFWQGGVWQQAVATTEHSFGKALEKRSWYGDAGIRLTPEAAQAFRDGLQRLYESYLRQSSEEGEAYFFFAGFAPT